MIWLFFAAIYLWEQRAAADYWQMFLAFIEQKAFWTVWFLAALFCGEVLLWAMLKVCRHRLLPTSLLSLCVMAATFLFYRSGGQTLYWCFDVGCVAQFFILLGYVCKLKYAAIDAFIAGRNKAVMMLLLFAVNVAAGFACIRLSGSSLDMSVGLYGNEVLTLISAISGIGALVLLCQMVSNRFLRYLGQNTMIFFAWHSRIILVACGMAFGALGIFQSPGLLSQYLSCAVCLLVILAVLYPVTEGVKRTRFRNLFGV